MRDMGKWPRLIVVGEPVTQEQANEILIRTQPSYLSSNDRLFKEGVLNVLGCHSPEMGCFLDRATTEALGILRLEYLHNDRIMSCWVGGPHGWCDWNGYIGASNYNIGKWPSHETVHDEWVAIATAFPYLKLRAQLISDEGVGEVAAQWQIESGIAVCMEPEAQHLAPVEDADWSAVFTCNGERGVSFGRLREAVAQVRASIHGRSRVEVHS